MSKSGALQLTVARRYSRREERVRVVEAWKRSGLNGAQYAAHTGIAVAKLYRWGRSTPRPATAVSFVELPPMASSSWAAEVTSRAGCVRLAGSASPVWAGALIRELNRC